LIFITIRLSKETIYFCKYYNLHFTYRNVSCNACRGSLQKHLSFTKLNA
jgi:hypothetical protein